MTHRPSKARLQEWYDAAARGELPEIGQLYLSAVENPSVGHIIQVAVDRTGRCIGVGLMDAKAIREMIGQLQTELVQIEEAAHP